MPTSAADHSKDTLDLHGKFEPGRIFSSRDAGCDSHKTVESCTFTPEFQALDLSLDKTSVRAPALWLRDERMWTTAARWCLAERVPDAEAPTFSSLIPKIGQYERN